MFIDVAPRKALLAPDGIFSSQHSIYMPLPKATMKYCIGLHFYAAPCDFVFGSRKMFY